ncbi:DNA polymerase epsilon subunit 2-like [Centruroides vittatus]|uniref:DNA polymerase epsilon subunit 2-like n=1 Tax=Centruroides vittatus TaxID=120091 RepID=UPI00350F76BD
MDEISDTSDDENFFSNNFDEQKSEDFDYSPEQLTETVDDLYIHRPLKWAFINLERFSLVNEIIYEEDEFESENASSEDDDSIHTNSELKNNEHSDDDVESIKEIQQTNVESDASSISSIRDDIEEENFVNNTNLTSLQVIQSMKSDESEKVYDDEQKQKEEFQDITECENSKNEDDRSLSKHETIEEYKNEETTNCMDIF